MQSNTTKISLIIVFTAIIACLVGLWVYHNTRPPILSITSGTILTEPKNIAPFKLQDKNQQAFTNQNLQNHWTFIFFGFTHCPNICPTTLSMLKQLYQNLQNDHVKQMPQIVFISVDPERDTAARLKEYLQNFNAAFEGATGDKNQIDALAQQFNVAYAKVFSDGDHQHYNIDHSGTLMLVNPQGKLFAIFTTPLDAKNIANDYEKIINQ